MRSRRLPIESQAPIVAFAGTRLMVTVTALLSIAILSFPYEGELFVVTAAVALPWSILLVVVARRYPRLALNPFVAAGDFAVLCAIGAAVPETYGAVRFIGLFLVAAHAHFQGAERGLVLAAGGSGAIVAVSVFTPDPLPDDLRHFYEALFVASALATAVVVGGLRTAESAGRIRARRLVRRSFEAEDDVRRRVADAIHDGPVQELASLEMMLHAVRQATQRGNLERAAELLVEAQQVTSRNIDTLRDEIVALGPQAFDQLSFEGAVEQSLPTWRRRHNVEVVSDCDALDLPPGLGGALFRIAQEAVANAGRHADAKRIVIRLTGDERGVELRVVDDGRGFGDVDPDATQPGHLGIASMRERAEAVGGRLTIATGVNGSVVRVFVPGDAV